MPKVESSHIRWFVATVLVCLGLYFGWEVVSVSQEAASRSNAGSVSVKPVILSNGSVAVTSFRTVCNAPKTMTKVVEIYKGDPRLHMRMYVFTQDDHSAEVAAHASLKGRMAGSGLHKFYLNHLCTKQAPGATPTSTPASTPASTPSTTPSSEAPASGSAAGHNHTQHRNRLRQLLDSYLPGPLARPETRSLLRAVSSASVGKCEGIVLDIGAFIGTQALILAKLGFEVHAFEPQTSAADLLRCSLIVNNLHNLHVTAEAISDNMGKECMMFPMAKLAHEASLVPKSLKDGPCPPQAQVPVVTLDHYWEQVLEKQQITLIKVNAEGHEEMVLQGGQRLFAIAPPPYILMDYDMRHLTLKGSSAEGMVKVIAASGYRVWDCMARAEVPAGAAGALALQSYQNTNGRTTLLLVHGSAAPKGRLPHYVCDA